MRAPATDSSGPDGMARESLADFGDIAKEGEATCDSGAVYVACGCSATGLVDSDGRLRHRDAIHNKAARPPRTAALTGDIAKTMIRNRKATKKSVGCGVSECLLSEGETCRYCRL